MTREEAIDRLMWLKGVPHINDDKWIEAVDMAIEALQAVPNCQKCAIKELWEETEKEDLVSVVRCKDCRYWDGEGQYCADGGGLVIGVTENDFCSRGERREE